MRKVEVVPHQDAWKEKFADEAKKLQEVLENEVINIYHIGSTSIPNIYAKPIIDILVEVKEISTVDHYKMEMEKLGYEAMGEYGIPGRRYFRKGATERTHHVHVFQTGSKHIIRHLAFKQYLIAHDDVAQHYSNLKRRLAKQYPTNMEAYINGKDPFIKEVEKRAIEWYKTYIQK